MKANCSFRNVGNRLPNDAGHIQQEWIRQPYRSEDFKTPRTVVEKTSRWLEKFKHR